MGSQLAKQGDHQPTNRISASGTSSRRRSQQQQQTSPKRTSPLADTPSSTSSGVSSINSQTQNKSRIIVVNAGPVPEQANTSGLVESRLKRLPALVRPLIPIGQTVVNPNYPQLLPQPIIDIGLELEQEFRANAELVAREQSKLVDKIRDIDQQVSNSAVTITTEKQRRFNKAVDNFGKFDEIDQLINRHRSQSLFSPSSAMIDFSSSGANLFGSASASPSSVSAMNPNQANSTSNLLSQFTRSGSTGSAASSSSMFSLLGSTGTALGPPPLDLTEFPSLGGASAISSFAQASSTGRPAYVGMVKDNVVNSSVVNEFNIQTEDFPALPGAPASSGGRGGGGDGQPPQSTTPTSASINAVLQAFGASQDGTNSSSLAAFSQQLSSVGGNAPSGSSSSTPGQNTSALQNPSNIGSSTARPDSTESSQSANQQSSSGTPGPNTGASGSTPGKKTSGVHLTKDGHIANIPPGMLTDQFGMAGLLALLQATESNANLYSLAIGYDITSVNLNLNSKERIYQTYPGPWNEKQLKPYEIDYPVPSEYQINQNIRDKMAEIKLNLYSEDLLFFMFYFFAGEQMQLLAINELNVRDWRFHKDEGVWLRRQGNPLEKATTYERGTYTYFDPHNWMKVNKDMTVEYDRLESPATGAQFQ